MKKETQCKHEEVMTVFSGGGDNNPITSCVRCHAYVVPKNYELPRLKENNCSVKVIYEK